MMSPFTDDGVPYDIDDWHALCARSSQTVSVRVDVLLDGTTVCQNINVVGGSVTMDRRAQHQRRCSVDVIDPDLVSEVDGGFLSPAGYELQIWRGIVDDDGVHVRCSLGVFGIVDSEVSGTDGHIRLDGWDRSRRVTDAKLTDAYTWASGGALEVYVADLMFRAFPVNPPYSYEGINHLTSPTVYEAGTDPWKIIVDAAGGVGYEAFFDGAGVFHWRPEPDLRTAEPIVELAEGASGVLTGLDLAFSREPSYNAWTVMSDNATDGTEIVATVYDNDPNSITYYYGPFGPKPADIVRNKTVATQADALAAAEARKAASLGIARSIDFRFVPNPALEPGDAVTLRRELVGIDEVVLIDALTVGLGAGAEMSGTVRARQELT